MAQVTMNDLRGVSMIALNANYKALLETQTILQLLVEKGVVTSEEVSEMRRKVDVNSPSVKLAKMQLDIATNAFNEEQFEYDRELDKFEDLFTKYLNDPKAVSEEEKEFINKQLDKLSDKQLDELSEYAAGK